MQPPSQTDIVKGRTDHVVPVQSSQNKNVRSPLSVFVKVAVLKTQKKPVSLCYPVREEAVTRCQGECSQNFGHFENLLPYAHRCND